MKVTSKLYAPVVALSTVGLLVAGIGAWQQRQLTQELDAALKVTAVRIDKVDSIRARAWEMIVAMRAAFMSATLKDAKKMDADLSHWEAVRGRMHEQFDEIRPVLISDENKAFLAQLETGLSEFEPAAREYLRLCKEGRLDEVSPYIARMEAFGALFDGKGRDFRNLQMKLLSESGVRADSLRSRSVFLGALLGSLLVVFAAMALCAARGIGRILTTAIGQLSQGAGQIARTVSHLASSSQSLAQGSSEQAAALEETSASSGEINAMAQKNGENSRCAAGLVTQSQQRFVQANESLDQMVLAIGEINTHSGRISKIIKVIDEIAFQTNILALNAAVEAARAGEAGMGFAVVAGEVRNLAQRCSEAARETAALIEESIAKSSDGKVKVDQVTTAIRTITGESAKVKTLVDEVNQGSLEQSRGMDEIAKTIIHMEQVTLRTAASAEESASAAAGLSAECETLKNVVDHLTAIVGGDESLCRRIA